MTMYAGSSAVTATRYSAVSDAGLRSMFTESAWQNLGETEKLDLLQETVNRVAMRDGVEPCRVSFENMPSSTRGCQSGDRIMLNREMFVEGHVTYRYGDTSIRMDMQAPNYLAHETALHEYQHSFQTQASEGKVDVAPELEARFASNNFTVTMINGQRASQYMLGKTENGYDLYYLNPTELDAYKTSQEQTLALVREHQLQNGDDASIASYLEQIAASGYDAQLAELKDKYGENVDKEVAQVLCNKYYNTNVPVDPNIEIMVEREMVATQQAIDNSAKSEVQNMQGNEWLDQHVTAEQYDAALRDSVNQYYEHAKNDPSVSQEEALASTSVMSEEYINAVEAFDSAQNTPDVDFDASASNGDFAQASADAGLGADYSTSSGSAASAETGTDGGCSAGGVGM